jgi:hypothetical protein
MCNLLRAIGGLISFGIFAGIALAGVYLAGCFIVFFFAVLCGG